MYENEDSLVCCNCKMKKSPTYVTTLDNTMKEGEK